eukprot:TRINITY_DN1508_c0_g1_i1.p1 TRINITY_DN1508_c0_g1~~TRINITY_DN1508_c0_g1_i1.p1  ORF type:complete len:125 (+),score=24.97 TRINITY_DN1508_c0_g1_i1:45-419(+)
MNSIQHRKQLIEERIDLYSSYRTDVYNDIEELSKLNLIIEQLKNSKDNSVEILNDIGQNVFCETLITDTSTIYINVGMGFYVEYTLEEAESVINKRLKMLRETGNEIQRLITVLVEQAAISNYM